MIRLTLPATFILMLCGTSFIVRAELPTDYRKGNNFAYFEFERIEALPPTNAK